MIKPDRILIVKLGAIGDVVHAMPVLSTLRANFPSAYIAWVVEEKTSTLLKGNPDLDKLIVINSKKWRKKPGLNSLNEIRGIVASLRKKKFDLAVDLQGLIKSGVIARLSGAKTVIGYRADCRREYLNGLFTTIKAGPNKNEKHVIDICLSILHPLKIERQKRDFFFKIPPMDENYVANFFLKNRLMGRKPIIALNPGAGWKTKEWGTDNYAKLGDKILANRDCDILITWGPGEERMGRAVLNGMKSKAILAPPTSLIQSVAFLKRCNLFVGPDTGPLHIAAALEMKTVAIFGPSDPERNGPYGVGHKILHKTLECSNCYKRTCTSARCMQLITVDDVFNSVNSALLSPLQISFWNLAA